MLLLEHVRVEVLLQLFVAVVDAQLFERVGLKDLEAKNVQHADDGRLGRLGIHSRVQLLDQPVEQPTVNVLRQCCDNNSSQSRQGTCADSKGV